MTRSEDKQMQDVLRASTMGIAHPEGEGTTESHIDLDETLTETQSRMHLEELHASARRAAERDSMEERAGTAGSHSATQASTEEERAGDAEDTPVGDASQQDALLAEEGAQMSSTIPSSDQMRIMPTDEASQQPTTATTDATSAIEVGSGDAHQAQSHKALARDLNLNPSSTPSRDDAVNVCIGASGDDTPEEVDAASEACRGTGVPSFEDRGDEPRTIQTEESRGVEVSADDVGSNHTRSQQANDAFASVPSTAESAASSTINAGRVTRNRGQKEPNYKPNCDRNGNPIKSRTKKANAEKDEKADAGGRSVAAGPSESTMPSTRGTRTQRYTRSRRKTSSKAPAETSTQGSVASDNAIEVSDDEAEQSRAQAEGNRDGVDATASDAAVPVKKKARRSTGNARFGTRPEVQITTSASGRSSKGSTDADQVKESRKSRGTSARASKQKAAKKDREVLTHSRNTSRGRSKDALLSGEDEGGAEEASSVDEADTAEPAGKEKEAGDDGTESAKPSAIEARGDEGRDDDEVDGEEEAERTKSAGVLQERNVLNAKPSELVSTPARKEAGARVFSRDVATPASAKSAGGNRQSTPGGTPSAIGRARDPRLHGRPLSAVLASNAFRSPGLRRSPQIPTLHLNRGPPKAARTIVSSAAADLKKKKRQKGYDSDEEREKDERKQRKLAAMTEQERHAYNLRRMEESYISSDDDGSDVEYAESDGEGVAGTAAGVGYDSGGE